MIRPEGGPTMAKRKNPHAVALGRRGGRVKGKKRWAHVRPEELSEIMRALARRRWHRRGSSKKGGHA
jgi:hypothetical protein